MFNACLSVCVSENIYLLLNESTHFDEIFSGWGFVGPFSWSCRGGALRGVSPTSWKLFISYNQFNYLINVKQPQILRNIINTRITWEHIGKATLRISPACHGTCWASCTPWRFHSLLPARRRGARPGETKQGLSRPMILLPMLKWKN